MAKERKVLKDVPVYGAQDGWSHVRKLEDAFAQKLCDVYNGQPAGYKVEESEKGYFITMKVYFPLTEKLANAEWWVKMIASATHMTGTKVTSFAVKEDTGCSGYARWAIWKNVEYRESSFEGKRGF